MKKVYLLILILFFVDCSNFSVNEDYGSDWIIHKSENFNFFVKPNSLAKLHIEKIIEEQEIGLAAVKRDTKIIYEGIINCYLFDDTNIYQRGTTGKADPDFEAVYVKFRGTNEQKIRIGQHENVHILAEQGIGRSSTIFFDEGFAVAFDRGYFFGRNEPLYNEMSVHKIIDNQRLSHGLASISELIENGENYPNNELYPQAGMFIEYLRIRYGINKVKLLYTVTKSNYREKFVEICGDSIEIIEEEYLVWLF